MSAPGDKRRAPARRTSGFEVALRLGVGMALPVFGGYALDRALGASPWFLLAGVVSGALFVMYDLVRRAGG